MKPALSANRNPQSHAALALRVTRVMLGFNLRDLAERSELDPTLISKYESGAREISSTAAEALGRALFAAQRGVGG